MSDLVKVVDKEFLDRLLLQAAESGARRRAHGRGRVPGITRMAGDGYVA